MMDPLELTLNIVEKVLGLAGIFLAAYLAYWFSVRSQQRLEDQKSREDAYAELRGLAISIPQLYTSLVDSDLFVDYFAEKIRRKKEGAAKEADRRKSELWGNRRYDLILEQSRLVGNLMGTLGRIERLYDLDAQGRNMLGKLFELPEPKMPESNPRQEKDLEAWWKAQQEQRVQFVKESYERPLKQLVDKLRVGNA